MLQIQTNNQTPGQNVELDRYLSLAVYGSLGKPLGNFVIPFGWEVLEIKQNTNSGFKSAIIVRKNSEGKIAEIKPVIAGTEGIWNNPDWQTDMQILEAKQAGITTSIAQGNDAIEFFNEVLFRHKAELASNVELTATGHSLAAAVGNLLLGYASVDLNSLNQRYGTSFRFGRSNFFAGVDAGGLQIKKGDTILGIVGQIPLLNNISFNFVLDCHKQE